MMTVHTRAEEGVKKTLERDTDAIGVDAGLTRLNRDSPAGLLVESNTLADEVAHRERCHVEQSHRD